ncbi:hypothetical protein AB0M02_46060 [Actinoplanes sp. NPDC051861]|uniref:hypothetical protein n=1 Tax=Actinoplanes sp. NPDC051861 TaxID=3155170 RepID=UPI0034289F6F
MLAAVFTVALLGAAFVALAFAAVTFDAALLVAALLVAALRTTALVGTAALVEVLPTFAAAVRVPAVLEATVFAAFVAFAGTGAVTDGAAFDRVVFVAAATRLPVAFAGPAGVRGFTTAPARLLADRVAATGSTVLPRAILGAGAAFFAAAVFEVTPRTAFAAGTVFAATALPAPRAGALDAADLETVALDAAALDAADLETVTLDAAALDVALEPATLDTTGLDTGFAAAAALDVTEALAGAPRPPFFGAADLRAGVVVDARPLVPNDVFLVFEAAPEAAGLAEALLEAGIEAAGIEVFLLANDCGHVRAWRWPESSTGR